MVIRNVHDPCALHQLHQKTPRRLHRVGTSACVSADCGDYEKSPTHRGLELSCGDLQETFLACDLSVTHRAFHAQGDCAVGSL